MLCRGAGQREPCWRSPPQTRPGLPVVLGAQDQAQGRECAPLIGPSPYISTPALPAHCELLPLRLCLLPLCPTLLPAVPGGHPRPGPPALQDPDEGGDPRAETHIRATQTHRSCTRVNRSQMTVITSHTDAHRLHTHADNAHVSTDIHTRVPCTQQTLHTQVCPPSAPLGRESCCSCPTCVCARAHTHTCTHTYMILITAAGRAVCAEVECGWPRRQAGPQHSSALDPCPHSRSCPCSARQPCWRRRWSAAASRSVARAAVW